MNPKVFVSHASEDKDRFVMNFAARLRAKGIDAWVDRWEMLPGDSLIEKIFEDGIKNAQAVVVVLSNNSVNKPWVREELNAAFVKRINSGSKLIPIVIDDCAVPEALQSTLWERIKDLTNYDAEFDRIVSAIFGDSLKPALGKGPAYAETILDGVPGLDVVDSIVLKLSCEYADELKHHFVGDVDEVLARAKLLDISEDQFFESLEILNSRYYIKGGKVHDGTDRVRHFAITDFGLEQYARTYIENYRQLVRTVGLELLNSDERDSTSIARKLQVSLLLVNHIVSSFKGRGWIKVVESNAGDFNYHVFQISPELKRALR